MSLKVKICGLTNKEAVDCAVTGGVDYIGFVFYAKSPRNITPKAAGKLAKLIPNNIETVAVVVDATDYELDKILKEFKPNYIQCHGSEPKERLAEIKKKYNLPIIKAVAVRSSDDVAKGKEYTDVANMLLFDSKAPTSSLPGGNGLSFDWTLLKARKFTVPWFLSGGLNIQNIDFAINISQAEYIDVSSALEIEPGIKDPILIKDFLNKVKN